MSMSAGRRVARHLGDQLGMGRRGTAAPPRRRAPEPPPRRSGPGDQHRVPAPAAVGRDRHLGAGVDQRADPLRPHERLVHQRDHHRLRLGGQRRQTDPQGRAHPGRPVRIAHGHRAAHLRAWRRPARPPRDGSRPPPAAARRDRPAAPPGTPPAPWACRAGRPDPAASSSPATRRTPSHAGASCVDAALGVGQRPSRTAPAELDQLGGDRHRRLLRGAGARGRGRSASAAGPAPPRVSPASRSRASRSSWVRREPIAPT